MRLDSRWTLTPVGGADKAVSFVALFQSQKGLNIATLLDLQKKDQQKIDNLKDRVRTRGHVLTFADFAGNKEADVEDMFDPAFYVQLFNSAFSSSLEKPLVLASLPPHPRIVIRIEEYLKQHPLKSGAGFNHFRPARYLAENVDAVKGNLDSATLQRFEEAFKALNALL